MAMLAGTRNKCVTHIIAAMSSPLPSRISAGAKENGYKISYRDTPTGGKKRFVLPLNYFIDASKYRMLGALARCTKPKLFVLGTKDSIIPPGSIRDTYRRSSEPKALIEVKSDHDYRKHPAIIGEINKAIGSFLEKF